MCRKVWLWGISAGSLLICGEWKRLSAQTLVYIDGASVYVQNNAQVYIYGGIQFTQNSALLQNDGEIFIRQDPAPGSEDWINNASPNVHTWGPAGQRTVYFETPYSEIRGNFSSDFYRLVIQGPTAGFDNAIVKLVGVDAYIYHQIDLTHEHLDVNDRYLYIENSDPNTAIARAGSITPPFSSSLQEGMFISTAINHPIDGGFVAWKPGFLNTWYYFPVGSQGSRFRPVGIRRNSGNLPDYFRVRFIDADPGNNNAIPIWCDVNCLDILANVDDPPNNLWYHVITTREITQADDSLRIFFDDDGAGETFNAILHWREDISGGSCDDVWSPRSFANWNNFPQAYQHLSWAGNLDAIQARFTFYYDSVPGANYSGLTPEGGTWYFVLTYEQDQIFPLNHLRLIAVPGAEGDRPYVHLTWTGEFSVPVDYFIVERMDISGSSSWIPLTEIPANFPGEYAGGNTRTWTYIDHSVEWNREYQYRIQAILRDGRKVFSPVSSVVLQNSSGVSVAPRILYEKHSVVQISLNLTHPVDRLDVYIWTPAGRQILQKTWSFLTPGRHEKLLTIPAFLTSGVYFLEIHLLNPGNSAPERHIFTLQKLD